MKIHNPALQIWLIGSISICVNTISSAQECKELRYKRGELTSEKIEFENTRRTYSVFLPSLLTKSKRPLLIGLHGYYGTGREFAEETANILNDLNQRNYVGIFPDGAKMSFLKFYVKSFNDIDSQNSNGPDGPTCTDTSHDYGVYRNCPRSQHYDRCNWGSSCSNDEGFIRKLIEISIDKWCIDPRRIFLTGFSQGAQTVQSLAWRMSDVIAAVAPHSGFSANGYSKAPQSKMSFVQIWSENDRTVDGNDRASSDGMIYESASETLSTWASAQKCNPKLSPYVTSFDGEKGWRCVEHSNCKNSSVVVSCSWNEGHTWADQSANSVMFDIFSKHHQHFDDATK